MEKEIETSLKVDRLGDEIVKNLGKDIDEVFINALGVIQEISKGALLRVRDIIKNK